MNNLLLWSYKMAKKTLKKVSATLSEALPVVLKQSNSKEKLTKSRVESIKLILTEIVLLGQEDEKSSCP